MPKVVDHDQRRAELIKHVWALIRSQGLDGVTIRALSERSGWSSGAVRHYLPDHASILSFAALALNSEVEQYFLSLDWSGPPLESFSRYLEVLLPLNEESQLWLEVWLAFLAAAVRGEDYADAHGILYQNAHAGILKIVRQFEEYKAYGWELSGTPEQVANALHAHVDGLALHMLLRQLTAEQARQSLQEMLRLHIREPKKAANS